MSPISRSMHSFNVYDYISAYTELSNGTYTGICIIVKRYFPVKTAAG